MSTTKISMRRFTALASETPDPTREPAEGDIYEVEDEENLPEDAKAQTIVLFRNEEDDEDLPVHVWVNDTDMARHTGLSNHESIDRDEGMLFDWGEMGTHGLMMRDMSFPIDMVFLDERGYVQQIVERVQPENPATYTSACQYALEMPSGFCEKHQIDTDWRVYREVRELQTNPQIVELQQVPDEAVNYTDPDEVPEGARTVTGPQSGSYYIPPELDPEREEEGSDSPVDLSERTAEIGDDSVHPAKWRRPDEGELDTYINEIQETGFWSDGHETFVRAYEGDENTENEYTDEEGNWDLERIEQHAEWAENLLNEDAATEEGEQPVGVVLLGPPGAGKGWWQEQVDAGEYGESFGGREFTHISSDRTKEPIPEYDGENAAEVHDEASRMAKEELTPQAFEDDHNVIVDKVATSPDSTIRMVEAMQEAGYDIRASFVDVPEEKSVHNAVGRYEEEGRFTPLDYTASARGDSRDSFDQIVEEVDIPDEKTGVFNNDVEWGQPPEPIEMGEDLLKFYRDFFGWDDEEMNRFMNSEDVTIYGDKKHGRQTRSGDRDRQRDSRVDGRGLRRGADRGDRSGPRVVDLDKQERDVDAYDDAADIVQVDHVHEAPDDVVVHCSPEDNQLYYVYGEHDVEKANYDYPEAAPEEAAGEVKQAVERFRSVVPRATKKETPLLYWLLGTDTPAYKMDKGDAAYQDYPKGDQQCSNCEYYYKGADGKAICSQVRGEVKASHWCRLWDELPETDSATVHTEGVGEDWYPITVIEAMAKQMDFELEIFRIVATKDIDMGLTSDLMAVGVNFPSHDVFVDWRTESWPDGEELEGPHVSIYSTMNDVRDVAQGEVEMLTTIDPAEGMSKQMSTPPGVPNAAEYLPPEEEPPEGASTYQGPQGATYYVPESTDNPDRASVEEFGGLTQTQAAQTPNIDIDRGHRKELLGYMDESHERINDALRGDAEMTEDLEQSIDVISSYIEDTPEFDEPVEVYRGLTASPDMADQLAQSEGGTIEMGGFQSTSHNPEVASRFTDFGEEGDVPVMMRIETENGLPIDNTNLESGPGGEEQEVLLGHNWTYAIDDVQQTDDGLVVDMEVVAND